MYLETLGRIPPHNEDAERSVLGSMLLDKDIIPEIAQTLTPDDFYRESHKSIYKTIVDIYNSNEAPDIINVSEKLKDINEPELTIDYLAGLTSSTITSASAKHHTKIVKGKSIRRQYIKAGNEIVDSAYDGNYENIIDLKNDVLQKVDIYIREKRKPMLFKHLYNNFVDRMVAAKENPSERVNYKYAMKWLDRNTGGLFKDLTIIAARPSVGKTALALQFASHIAKQGAKVTFFNLEMTAEQLTDRLVSSISCVDSSKIRTLNLDSTDTDKINQVSDVFNEIELNIIDDIYKIEEINAKCREIKIKQGLDIVIIDYLQLCETMKKTSNSNEKVSHMSRTLKIMQKDLGITLILLSQLSRDNVKGNRKPILTDLRDSGAIEQDADNVLFLHDPKNGEYAESKELYEDRQLIIAKQRNGQRDIYTDLKFYPTTQTFCEVKL